MTFRPSTALRRHRGRGAPVAPIALGLALALAAGGCSGRADREPKAAPTTTAADGRESASPAGAAEAGGPVTDAELDEVDAVLRRLDSALDRLDSDMAAGEGETRQVVLDSAKRAAVAAVTRRVLALRELALPVRSLSRIGEEERIEVAAQIQAQVNGLTGLTATIQGASDEAGLRAAAQRVVTDYRVYVLTIPKVRGIVVADIELNAADRLADLAERLSGLAERGRADEEGTGAGADLASLRARLSAVTAAVAPLPAALLALEPGGHPANQAGLEQARQILRTGRADLADAAGLARTVVADLN